MRKMRTPLSKDTKAVLRVLRTELRTLISEVHRIADAIVALEYDVASKFQSDNIRAVEHAEDQEAK